MTCPARYDRQVGRRGLVVLALTVLGVAGCTTGAGSTASTSTKPTVPLPAGANPSRISEMVCSPDAAKVIHAALGEKAAIDEVAWVDHRYSCRYGYPTGSPKWRTTSLGATRSTEDAGGLVDSNWACALAGPAVPTSTTTAATALTTSCPSRFTGRSGPEGPAATTRSEMPVIEDRPDQK